jgi:hypothetical protein
MQPARSEHGENPAMTTTEPCFTLDEIKRALIADYYAEGTAGGDSTEDYEMGEHDKRKGVEHFERLRSWLFYVRENPGSWKDPADG